MIMCIEFSVIGLTFKPIIKFQLFLIGLVFEFVMTGIHNMAKSKQAT